MVLGNVECGKIIEVGFYFRSRCNGKTKRMKQGLNTIQCSCYGMYAAYPLATPRQSDVQRFDDELGLEFLFLYRVTPATKGSLEHFLGFIDTASHSGALVRGKFA